MYSLLKLILKKVLSKKLLFKFELIFRFLYFHGFKGTNFQCNICRKKLRRFIYLPDGDLLCPNCGSISRTRRLWQTLDKEFINPGIKILDFSPSRSIYRKFRKMSLVSYCASDISGDFISDKQLNITNIDEYDDTYNLIICYHILEHIDNDNQAMHELLRILKKGGSCIIQTPFKEGDIYENPAITTKEERLKHFGQDDHVRVYSVKGLKNRLISAGFSVNERKFKEEKSNYHGFNENETILVCVK